MAEPFFRFAEMVVPAVVAMNGTKLKFEGLENIPARGGALIALNHTSYLDWMPASIAAHERKRRLHFMIKAEMADVKAVNYVIKHCQAHSGGPSEGARRVRGGRAAAAGGRTRRAPSRGHHQSQLRTPGVQVGNGALGAGRSGADNSSDCLGRAPDLAQGSSKEGVPQQGSDHRGRRTAAAAAGRHRATHRRAAARDERVAVPGAGGISAPGGGVLGAAQAGWHRAEPRRFPGDPFGRIAAAGPKVRYRRRDATRGRANAERTESCEGGPSQ